MTKKKQTNRLLIPAVVLVLLVVVLLLTTDPFGWMKPPADAPDLDSPEVVTLCSATADAITAFELGKPGEEPFRLERSGDDWQVVRGADSYRANQERIDKLIDEVPGLKSGSLATDKADKHATFEVDDATAIVLKVYTGDASPAAHLLVGKATPSYSGAFIRLNGQDKVYRANKNVKSLVGFSFGDYCSKVPWEFDPGTAERLVIAPPSGEGEALEFSRNDGLWQTADGGNGNQNLLNEFIDNLSKLRVSSFVDDPDPELSGLVDALPAAAVTAKGIEYQLIIGAKDESQYFAKDHDGHVYMVSEYNLKSYHELLFNELVFDDTVPEDDNAGEQIIGEMEPDEGVSNGLPSDIDE